MVWRRDLPYDGLHAKGPHCTLLIDLAARRTAAFIEKLFILVPAVIIVSNFDIVHFKPGFVQLLCRGFELVDGLQHISHRSALCR